MFQILLENKLLTGIILSLLLLSIICQIIIGVIYQKLIREAENLSTTENKQLKLCKLKFQNCYQMNGSVPNIAVFVDKFISRLEICHISLTGLRQIATQLVMLSVFVSGIGACVGIIAGETLFRILPYYLISIVGLYLFFSISAIVDLQVKKDNLKINLMDYLENHMLSRLKNIEESAESREKPVPQSFSSRTGPSPAENLPPEKNAREKELKAAIAAFSEEEIEELLKELLI